MKRTSILVIYILSCLLSIAQNTFVSSPKREVRAVWLTTIGGLDWPHSYAQSALSAEKQKREFRDILDKLQQSGINTVLLQTRIRATVIYPSTIEPWDGCLSGMPGRSPGYDALRFAIEECHKRGMEIQAWVVTIPVGKWNGMACRRLRKHYPGLIKRIGDDGYMNPEMAKTAEYIARICEEIVKKYDVDGIHLDYIRYPEQWEKRVSNAVGRQYITRIVSAIYNKVKTLKPWVKMSCSPVGKHDDLSRYWSHGWNAYTKVCQDAQGWLKMGLMDELFPMMYFKDDQFFPFAINWKEEDNGKIVVPGMGIYFMSPAEQNWSLSIITRQMNVLRQFGMGHAYFRSKFFTDNLKGIYSYAAYDFDRFPALVPAMTWLCNRAPDPPKEIKTDTLKNMISWNGATDHSNAPYLLYNVYASRKYPVDVNDARNLVSMRKKETFLQTPVKPGLYYAVTAMDRYGNESEPVQSFVEKKKAISLNAGLLKCDAKWLLIPGKGSTLDANFIIIETLQGGIVATLPYTNGKTDVSKIPDGYYIVRSVNKKGVTHRLGEFIIKR